MIDRAWYGRVVRGVEPGPGAACARLGLGVVSLGYGLAVAARNRAYDRRRLRTYRASVPVISVGNLTLGGTGKTPMVEWVARRLRARGLRVAILSRGYGGDTGLNDEGTVLEENLPDVPHLQGADRSLLARTAVEELESQVLVLDDGFQHRRLERDLDLVLLDALDPFGAGRMFPRGLLREPLRSLRRASVVVLSRADLVDESARNEIRRIVTAQAGERPWVLARHAPVALVNALESTMPLAGLRDQSIAAFCGIGNPEGFRRTLAGLIGRDPPMLAFPDHHPYSASDLRKLEEFAIETRADLVLTTQKDLVKIRCERLGHAPLFALRIGLECLSGADLLEAAVARVLGEHPSSS